MPKKDAKLLELRNKKLIERYYYWSEVKRLRFDDVLQVLKYKEFFLEENYILSIISNYSWYMDELMKRKPRVVQLNLFEV